MVTSNHLLVVDGGSREVIPRAIQLVAGRTGQEFNQRKDRTGAYWEDRYHATAVESGDHLLRCIVYIDLNMVRTEVVNHPSQWAFSGYNEIQEPRQRYGLVDYQKLLDLVGIDTYDAFRRSHRGWVEKSLRYGDNARESKWTDGIAVGSKAFVERTKERLGISAKGRKVLEAKGAISFEKPWLLTAMVLLPKSAL
jgi:hypothetical protein